MLTVTKFQVALIPLLTLLLATSWSESMELIRTKAIQYDHSGSGELKIDFSASHEILSANSEVKMIKLQTK